MSKERKVKVKQIEVPSLINEVWAETNTKQLNEALDKTIELLKNERDTKTDTEVRIYRQWQRRLKALQVQKRKEKDKKCQMISEEYELKVKEKREETREMISQIKAHLREEKKKKNTEKIVLEEETKYTTAFSGGNQENSSSSPSELQAPANCL